MNGTAADATSAVLATLDRLQPILDRYGLLALFAANLVVGFGIPLPGQTLLIACGLLAAQGRYDLVAVIATAWIATMLGNGIGFAIGKSVGPKLMGSQSKHAAIFHKAEGFFERYGVGVLVVARFVDGISETSNLAAGALKMSWLRFLVASAVGTTLWVTFFGLGAFYRKEDFHEIAQWFESLKPYA